MLAHTSTRPGRAEPPPKLQLARPARGHRSSSTRTGRERSPLACSLTPTRTGRRIAARCRRRGCGGRSAAVEVSHGRGGPTSVSTHSPAERPSRCLCKNRLGHADHEQPGQVAPGKAQEPATFPLREAGVIGRSAAGPAVEIAEASCCLGRVSERRDDDPGSPENNEDHPSSARNEHAVRLHAKLHTIPVDTMCAAGGFKTQCGASADACPTYVSGSCTLVAARRPACGRSGGEARSEAGSFSGSIERLGAPLRT